MLHLIVPMNYFSSFWLGFRLSELKSFGWQQLRCVRRGHVSIEATRYQRWGCKVTLRHSLWNWFHCGHSSQCGICGLKSNSKFVCSPSKFKGVKSEAQLKGAVLDHCDKQPYILTISKQMLKRNPKDRRLNAITHEWANRRDYTFRVMNFFKALFFKGSL